MDKIKMKESELYLECGCCGDKISLREDFRYETRGYTPFCRDFDCIDGIATEGTCLEVCWWGGEELEIEWGK